MLKLIKKIFNKNKIKYWEISYLKEINTILYVSKKESTKIPTFNKVIKNKKIGFFTQYFIYIKDDCSFSEAKFNASNLIQGYFKDSKLLNEHLDR